jgi:Putative prokaryotic signal transducing protein
MSLVTVYATLNLADAELVRSRLEAAQFHAVLMNDIASTTYGPIAAGGILVQVPEAEERDAREFLKQESE